MNDKTSFKVGDAVANKFGTKGEVIQVFAGGLINVRMPCAAGTWVVCLRASELSKACCNGASRDCLTHGDGN